jgi:alkaline phosphatase D
MTIRIRPKINRRRVLTGLGTSALVGGFGLARPAISRAADRPVITHGVQSGDVAADSGVVWARADRPSRMLIEVATSDSFKDVRDGLFVDALPESDFTAKAIVENLPAGQDIFYRVRFQDLASPTILGEPVIGRFRTAPADRRSVSFVWSGDTAGQGWGIDLARGGMRTYAAMLKNRPDFFIHSGDTIYADAPIPAEIKLADGTLWKNIVTEDKSKPAETLGEFRGNYKYNLLDRNVLAFNSEIPMFAQWDDHEVTNNWWPGEPLTREEHLRKKYMDKNVLAMAARAGRAFHEYMPLRPAPAEPGRVKRELMNSRATWKVIAADMPLGLVVVYDFDRQWGIEAIAQGDGGQPRGRELEVADILSFIKHAGIRNTVWLTADVHYTAAHYYDPNKAVFQDFEPFWEFVSGPIHAGNFGAADLDGTFGPQLRFIKASAKEQGMNVPPTAGLQFFGHVSIEGSTGLMTVTLKDWDDRSLWSTNIEPKLA